METEAKQTIGDLMLDVNYALYFLEAALEARDPDFFHRSTRKARSLSGHALGPLQRHIERERILDEVAVSKAKPRPTATNDHI